MLCLAPLPEEERLLELTSLLAKEPYTIPPKEPKLLKDKGGPRIREPSEAGSEETHASSTHEEEEEEGAKKNIGEGVPSPKGEKVASKDAEEEAHPRGQKRLCKALVDHIGQQAALTNVMLSDSSDGYLFQPKRTKLVPRRYFNSLNRLNILHSS